MAGLLLALLLGCGGEDKGQRRPDLLLVVIDALRRDHVGVYGYPRPTTPFLDALAQEGVIFEQAWAQASQTFNSTSTLFTSRLFPYLSPGGGPAPVPGLPPEAGRRFARVKRLMPENLTIAEALSDAGYQTVGLFTNPYHHEASGFWQGFEAARYLPPDRRGPYPPAPHLYEAFFDWLDRRGEGPYFAYLHFMDPHFPYLSPRKLQRRFARGPGGRVWSKRELAPGRQPAAADLAHMQDRYDAAIFFVDRVLEQLWIELGRREEERETLVVVTSDHGEEFLDHGGLGHGGSLERELLAVPLIFGRRGPERAPGWPVARVDRLVRNLDLGPTLLELAGLEAPAAFEGRSLVSLLEGREPPAPPPARSFAWVGRLRSLTTDRWHFIADLDRGPLRLYDGQADPRGVDDLRDERPEVVAELAKVVARFERTRRATDQAARRLAAGSEPAELDPAIRAQLRALGYLD